MSGLLRRLSRRRSATADEDRSTAIESSEPVAAPAETPAESGGEQPVPGPDQPTQVLPATADQAAVAPAPEQPTAFAAQPAPARDLPAGVDPADLAAAPAPSARRGKLRRRLRYLLHVRELLLRDLGGFTYEIHRSAGGTTQEPQRVLAAAKAKRISTLDAEVAALEEQLGEPHGETVLREPGIGGICPRCGELHASDAHFCSRCGEPLDARARSLRESAQPATGSQPVVEPEAASVLWAGGPRPATSDADETPEEAEKPAAVTSAWLASEQPTTAEKRASTRPAPETDEPQAEATDEPHAEATDEPQAEPTDEPDEPTDDATAPSEPTEAADDPKPDGDEPAVNGRRDEDGVPRPFTSGDPLASPREQK